MSEIFLARNSNSLSKYYIKNSNRIVRSVNSDYICSLPQFSPTSESFVTLNYVSNFMQNKKIYLARDFFIGIFRVLILSLSIRTSKKKISASYHSLVISHDVINNNNVNDFYFGSHENITNLCGSSYKLIYISHSLLPELNKKNHVLINRNLSFLDYLIAVNWHMKSIIFGLITFFKKSNSSFRYLIFKSLLRGDGLEGYLRSNGLIKLLPNNRNSKLSIYITIEGHSWEKMIIKLLKRLDYKNLIIYGYSHSIIRASTSWVKNLDKREFSPDILLVSKEIYFNHIISIWKDREIFSKLSLYKSLKPKIKFLKSDLPLEPHILLLPEGLRDEECLFLLFANEIKKLYPSLKISVKWHPNATGRLKSTTQNEFLQFSEVENYSHVIFRGTYGIFDFIGSNKKLLYLKGVDLPNTNPLFMAPKMFTEISVAQDLIDIIHK